MLAEGLMPSAPRLQSPPSEGSLYSVESIGAPWHSGVPCPCVRYPFPIALCLSLPTYEQS